MGSADLRHIVCRASALLMAACTAHSNDGVSRADLEKLESRYQGEHYKVLIVDRTKFDERFKPKLVVSPYPRKAGSIIVSTKDKFMYLILPDGKAMRYGVAVGQAGYGWSGEAVVGRKAKWPAWYPTDDMRSTTPDLPHRIDPGPHNPLGARAIYLYSNGRDTLYRIHGTSEPWTIGTEASSGCIRMLNEDVIDLFDRVSNGANVTVI